METQIIELSLSATTDYARCAIGNTTTAVVHSVYDKAINILINDKLFTFQPKNTAISPISLITDLSLERFRQLSLLPEKTYRFNLNYRNGAIFGSKLTACILAQKNELAFYTGLAEQILQRADTAGLRLLLQSHSEDLVLSAAQKYLTRAACFYRLKDNDNAAQLFARLIGLGIGLTPSGDDFLCGMLATLQRFNYTQTDFYRKLAKQIRQNLNRTNPISGRFLDCALEGQFSAAVLTFFESSEQRVVDINQIGELFENIGHSSGTDTLFGIYYTCKLLS